MRAFCLTSHALKLIENCPEISKIRSSNLIHKLSRNGNEKHLLLTVVIKSSIYKFIDYSI